MKNKKESPDFDVVIVGGGLVGASLALALDTAGRYRIGIIEPNPPPKFDPSKTDLRVTALNNFSVNLLKKLAVWDRVLGMRAAPFCKVVAWEESVTPLKFDAKEIGMAQLGYMVENTVLLSALTGRINQSSKITLIRQAANDVRANVRANEEPARITLADGKVLTARLVVGADGYRSLVRGKMQVGSIELRHPQKALVLHIKTPYPQRDTTWQRFTPTGAQAFLPMAGNNASLVWYNTPDYADYLATLEPEKLCEHLVRAFPAKLGKVSVQNRISIPIVSHHAQRYFRDRAVLIGDAAHSVHPLAGLGANLGLQDVSVLAKKLTEGERFGPAELASYEQERKHANLLFVAGLEAIYHTFDTASPLLGALRRTALLGGRLPLIKKFLMQSALGGN